MRNGHIFLARACPGMGPSGTGRLGQCPFGKFLARALTIGQRALNGHTLYGVHFGAQFLHGPPPTIYYGGVTSHRLCRKNRTAGHPAKSARVSKNSLQKQFQTSISRILELFVENQSKTVPRQLNIVYACNFSNFMLLENIFNFINIAGSIYFGAFDFAVFCRQIET